MDQKSSDRKRTALREKSVNTHMATKVRSINHTVTTLNNLLSKIPNNSTPTAPSTKPQTYLGASQTVSDDEVWLLSSPDVTLPQAISTPIKNVSVNLEGLTLVDQNLKDERRLEITKVHSKNKKSDRIILQSPEPAMGQNIRASPSSSPPPNPRKTRKRGATKFKIDKRSRRNYHDPAKHFSSDDVNLLL
ncbi:hypothetical protein NADFUDRAFT_39275 [Nadsonia fulvescens var. elongata DSM 6958]|uniref:Uncharacterized protein n=1 Tax=Nadsonia fulvescens var. elongata DSM 6958 TaxID=857566 RepID=A0A1E3PR04_9ASCO|nr:hypothetical protein NADFUDRAFT_39275 [Nadsonia fulvescens var. elongata DSM 6958]